MPNQRLKLLPFGGAVASGGTPSTLLTGLISYWKMNESSSGVAPVTRVDSVVASANDLTDTNNTPSGTGKISNAANPSLALSQKLTHASNASLQTGDIDFSLAFWYNPTLLPAVQTVICAKTTNSSVAGSTEWSVTTINGTQYRFYVSDGTTLAFVQSTVVMSAGNWYFYVCWHDSVANTINIQVNNGTAVSAAYSNGVLANGSNFIVSGDGIAGRYVTGFVDEMGFWKKVLTAGEKTSLYNAGAGVTWPF